MKLIPGLLVILLVVCSITNHVDAIRCYDCTSSLGGECDNVKDSMIKNCSEAVACLSTEATSSSGTTISRKCGGPILIYNNSCTNSTSNGIQSKICECDTDLCNGPDDNNSSTSIKTSLILFIVMVMAVTI